MSASRIATAALAARRRAVTLVALGAAGLALFAAGPASAKPVQTGARKGCTIYSKASGVTYTVPDGTVITRNNANGTTQTQTCNDGVWVTSNGVVAAGPISQLPAVQVSSGTAAFSPTR